MGYIYFTDWRIKSWQYSVPDISAVEYATVKFNAAELSGYQVKDVSLVQMTTIKNVKFNGSNSADVAVGEDLYSDNITITGFVPGINITLIAYVRGYVTTPTVSLEFHTAAPAPVPSNIPTIYFENPTTLRWTIRPPATITNAFAFFFPGSPNGYVVSTAFISQSSNIAVLLFNGLESVTIYQSGIWSDYVFIPLNVSDYIYLVATIQGYLPTSIADNADFDDNWLIDPDTDNPIVETVPGGEGGYQVSTPPQSSWTGEFPLTDDFDSYGDGFPLDADHWDVTNIPRPTVQSGEMVFVSASGSNQGVITCLNNAILVGDWEYTHTIRSTNISSNNIWFSRVWYESGGQENYVRTTVQFNPPNTVLEVMWADTRNGVYYSYTDHIADFNAVEIKITKVGTLFSVYYRIPPGTGGWALLDSKTLPGTAVLNGWIEMKTGGDGAGGGVWSYYWDNVSLVPSSAGQSLVTIGGTGGEGGVLYSLLSPMTVNASGRRFLGSNQGHISLPSFQIGAYQHNVGEVILPSLESDGSAIYAFGDVSLSLMESGGNDPDYGNIAITSLPVLTCSAIGRYAIGAITIRPSASGLSFIQGEPDTIPDSFKPKILCKDHPDIDTLASILFWGI